VTPVGDLGGVNFCSYNNPSKSLENIFRVDKKKALMFSQGF